ncbi:MAG: hypothetical protein GY856_09915 [bacterium]|nr:hypothetical protein [bacterium]
MPQMSFPNRLTAISAHLLLLLSLMSWLVGSPKLNAAALNAVAPENCLEALPLPLDHSIHGYATAWEPVRYAIDVQVPCILVTEAHGIGSPPVSAAVRFLDRSCRPQATNLPLPAIRGRHVHRVSMPGTYYVEIVAGVADDLADGSFRLDAWLVPDPGLAAGVLKNDGGDGGDGGDGNEEPPREPMDEWDEQPEIEDGGRTGTRAFPKASRPVAWQEIAGHGVVELVETPGGRETRFHPWCPWPERPGLLRTFTCAPQLRVDESRTLTVHPLLPETTELVGLTLATAGRIALGAAGESDGSAALFDAQGRLIAELVNGEPSELAAGRYFLQVETSTDADAIRLDAEFD